MTEIAIRIDGLGKRYKIGREKIRYDTLRDWLAGALATQFDRIRSNGKGSNGRSQRAIWALRDVSLEVSRGEVLGVIGHNGAGKTTLLKILSRITEPTVGRVRMNGRVGSLLEVGTGFHPELTGRENIYLNGAILGMKRVEINAKFDEIVAFAEIDRFLDTPVKRYSSGMYVRLAFAVAAHLEPEILLVDEVLAVGDINFQKKCLGKMGEVAKTGRTVLFISHNMDAISSLCDKAIILQDGRITGAGFPQVVIEQYLEAMHAQSSLSLSRRRDRRGDGRLRFTEIFLRDRDGNRIDQAQSGQQLDIVAEYETQVNEALPNVNVSFSFSDQSLRFLFLLDNTVSGHHFDQIPPAGKMICRVPRLPLSPGSYFFNAYASVNGSIADWVLPAIRVNVTSGEFYKDSRLIPADHGGVLVDHQWVVEPE